MNPEDATVSIRPEDCVDCVVISGLVPFNKYYVRVRAENARGLSDYTSFLETTPREIPNAPASLTLTVVSSTELYALFTPPVGAADAGITGYTVQWDYDQTFAHAMSAVLTCNAAEAGVCLVFGDALQAIPPYKYLIQGLVNNKRYYVRVAARNAIQPQQTDPTGTIPDNTRWSQTASAVTANQVPSPVVGVQAIVSGKQSVQLIVQVPVSNGGLTFADMIVEWDVSKSFSTQSYGTRRITYSSLKYLTSAYNSPAVVSVDGLKTGESYWFRVSVSNTKGTGIAAITTTAATPSGKANAPASVQLTHATVQASDITNVTVSWTPPSGTGRVDGGNPITGYVVEWWEHKAVNEVQLLRYTTSNPGISSPEFKVAFGPSPDQQFFTSAMPYSISASNLRSELVNLGFGTGAQVADFVMNDLSITRSRIPDNGYQWSITFVGNSGDQVPLVPKLVGPASGDEMVDVVELVKGQRAGGNHEKQIITIKSSGASAPEGWFRLTFKGNMLHTHYLPLDCSETAMIEAIEQLQTIRQVDVKRVSIISGTAVVGYSWTVEFLEDIGDMPSIAVDATHVRAAGGTLSVVVDDGDNSVDPSTGAKLSLAFPGEAPFGYHSALFGADVRSMIIQNLVPGTAYYVAVSAVNGFGVGPLTSASGSFATPPKQIPQPPTSVSVDTNFGSASTLAVSFAPPLFNGGAKILKYRVELDNVAEFTSAIYNDIMCSTSNVHTVYAVETQGVSSNPVTSGSFKLRIGVRGRTFDTDAIPHNAAAMQADEMGVLEQLKSFTATATSGQSTISTSANPREYVFVNDRLVVNTQSRSDAVYTVTSVTSNSISVTPALDLTSLPNANVILSRLTGGRASSTYSRVFCLEDGSLCSSTRVALSGSMQSKLEILSEAVPAGVHVIRTGPNRFGGYTWMVTFKDNSPANPSDYSLSVVSGTAPKLESGVDAVVTTRLVVDGESYPDCSEFVSTHVVPKDKALTMGEYYFARVSAFNEIGYSLPQRAPSAQKPMVVPGRPTSVVISVLSKSDIKVSFNPPESDGGDTVTEYKIEYATDALFSDVMSEYVTYLQGGAPFFKTLTGLQKGTYYYVRVSAKNSQGYGEPAVSTPASIQPHEAPGGPTNVFLAVTSNSMLTVSFNAPLSDGGDQIVSYRIEWDVQPSFSSNSPKPHKDFVEVDASTFNSYTIRFLDTRQYYVRVFAINAAGPGAPALSSPPFATPALVTPGRPHTIAAVTGTQSSEIRVTWLRPRIPWHGIPCSGTAAKPFDCPSPVGGGLPTSTGGTPITEYQIEYNEVADFSGQDRGVRTTTDVQYVLTGLTPGRTYFIRVLARNAMGSGPYCHVSDVNCNTANTVVTAVAAA
jgi:hypothetical protein